MQALLVAGEPRTGSLGGWMSPVANRPWIEHLIRNSRDQGVRDFVIAVRQDEDGGIRDLLGDGVKYGVHIAYLAGWEPLGAAGALKVAEPLLQDRFAVVHGNVVHAFRLDQAMAYHAREGASATICLTASGTASPYGVAKIGPDGRVLSLGMLASPQDAPSILLNSGVYMMSKSALSRIPEGRCVSLEKELFPLLIGIGSEVVGYVQDEYWTAVDTSESYARLHWDVLDRKLPLSISGTEMNEKGIWIGEGARIGKGVLLVPPVVIGDDAVIGDKAILGPYTVIGPRCRIGGGSRISRSVLSAGSVVSKSSRLSECVLGNGAPSAEASLSVQSD